jgi:uncharacterized protein (DUF1501 family)
MSTRRIFLRDSALAMVGVGVLPSWLTRTAWAAAASRQGKILVVIFQRGAADGLNVVVPHGEAAYYQYRPTIAIPRPHGRVPQPDAAIDLDGFFGLHPSLIHLKPLWDMGHMAIVHAAGSPDPSRSHFQAQDYMEAGTPGQPDTTSGWLNRVLRAQCPDCESAGAAPARVSPLRAIALDAQMPLTLRGPAPAVAISDLAAFRVGYGPQGANAAAALQSLYDHDGGALLQPAGRDTFAALRLLRHLDPHKYQPAAGANYPRRGLGHGLRQIAQLIKANVGVEVAFADIGGWDNHVAEGSTTGQLAGRLREFGDALAAFWTDLGDRAGDVVVVTMSEFGRTAHENGSAGTDHGHANVMFVLGGTVRGGQVYGRWPGLAAEQLYQGRDLALTTDFRLVLAEAVRNHLGVGDLAPVFPGFAAQPSQFRGFLRTHA